MGGRDQLVECKKEETDWGEKRTGGGQDWGGGEKAEKKQRTGTKVNKL
jgi:hypothetical protein